MMAGRQVSRRTPNVILSFWIAILFILYVNNMLSRRYLTVHLCYFACRTSSKSHPDTGSHHFPPDIAVKNF
jgi:hypothetical protein